MGVKIILQPLQLPRLARGWYKDANIPFSSNCLKPVSKTQKNVSPNSQQHQASVLPHLSLLPGRWCRIPPRCPAFAYLLKLTRDCIRPAACSAPPCARLLSPPFPAACIGPFHPANHHRYLTNHCPASGPVTPVCFNISYCCAQFLLHLFFHLLICSCCTTRSPLSFPRTWAFFYSENWRIFADF